ncbi:MAG: serine/threonine protein kinase, partial [Myxococcales bacterium]|nr:serine/threonine protein kinase [Myxococcales bacterium]
MRRAGKWAELCWRPHPPGDYDESVTDTVDDVAARRSRRRLLRKTLDVGEMIGRYRIVSQLGAGGMGIVYRAHDADLGRDVALKLVTTGEEPTDTLASRLLREAQALAQLNHPNVVAVYDVGRVDGGVFLAMELVPGETGEVWIKSKPKWREALAVFRDAGRGLAAAHEVGLVHRDFKPANLILGSDGRVRVLDFGLARAAQSGNSGEVAAIEPLGDEVATWSGIDSGAQPTRQRPATPAGDTPPTSELTREEPSSRRSAPRKGPVLVTPIPKTPAPNVPEPISESRSSGRLLETPLTQVGAIVGTPPYMAPEQHLGAGCDARTDQFSFCVAFYQALYGERPFDGSNYAELSTNILKGNVRAAPASSDIPSWLRAIVMRGLEVAPENRWPTMDAILEAMANDPAARWRRIGRW